MVGMSYTAHVYGVARTYVTRDPSRTPSPTSRNVGLPRCTGDAYGPRCALLAIECSARCGARPGAPPLDPARFFVKKRGKKLLGLGLGGL